MKTAADFTRPSALRPVSLCAGRPAMEAAVVNTYGEPEESPEASMGTKAHAYVAFAIQHAVIDGCDWAIATDLYCNTAQVDGMDHWTVWCIRSCLEFARDLITRHGIERENVLVEHPLELADLGMPRQGTADLILVVPFKRVIVIDWKFTFLDQGDATDHDQLQAYATAAAADFRTQAVEVWLFAPRDEKAKRATGATFDAAALAANAAWTRAVVARAKAPNPELTPGYEQCLYCRALTRCAAAKEWIMNTREALAFIGTPLDPDAWGELAAASKIADKFAEDAKEQTKAHLIGGGNATGWGLGSGRCIRSCSNPAQAIQRLEQAGMGAMALEAVSLSPAKLPDEALAVIADLVIEKPSAPSLKAVKARAVAA
jgi:hypothetical protein